MPAPARAVADDDGGQLPPAAPLQELLRRALGRPHGELVLEGLAGVGRSNVTILARFDGDEIVVRHPPRGELLPTAHDIEREHRFLTALADAPLPTPRPLLLCGDPTVIGVPFYVMERMTGTVLEDALPAGLAQPEERRSMCESMVDTLVALHAVDWRPLGLRPRPGDFLARQVRRWSTQRELTPTAGRLKLLPRLERWVAEHLPAAQSPTVVHGDFEVPNMMFGDPPGATVSAVLDWEMATIGDPIADLMWMLRDWGVERPSTATAVLTRGDGAPTRRDMAERYTRLSGRAVPHPKFYLLLALWKDAVILEGLHAGFVAGNAPNPENERYEWEVPQLVEHAVELIETLDPDEL